MATKKTKSAAVAVQVPLDRDDCARFITVLGGLMRQQALQKSLLDGKVAELADQFAPVLNGLGDEIKRVHAGIQTWCEGNRAALTDGYKTKTVKMLTGDVVWRQRPPSVTVRDVEALIKTLKTLGLGAYVHTAESVNKEAILALDSVAAKITDEQCEDGMPGAAEACRTRLHRELIDGLKGITIVKGVEDFSVVPAELEAPLKASTSPAAVAGAVAGVAS